MLKSLLDSFLDKICVSKNKRQAFTLAEVLITLGIIGVVAAMTIPTLITNTKGAQYRAQFKKSLSTLNQAARMSQAQYDFNYAAAGMCSDDAATENPTSVMTMCSLLNGTLAGATYVGTLDKLTTSGGKTYAKALQDGGVGWRGTLYGSVWNGGYLAYTLADGSIFAFYNDSSGNSTRNCTFDGSMTKEAWMAWYADGNYCSGFIDVNGVAGPNQEIVCENLDDTSILSEYASSCKVSNSSIGDIIPVAFYDGTVVPSSNAAKAFFESTK